jgi:hypothetical protein
MSDSATSTISFGGIWFVMFLVVKLAGTAFAHWSWFWVLLPIVPDVVLICRKLGFL